MWVIRLNAFSSNTISPFISLSFFFTSHTNTHPCTAALSHRLRDKERRRETADRLYCPNKKSLSGGNGGCDGVCVCCGCSRFICSLGLMVCFQCSKSGSGRRKNRQRSCSLLLLFFYSLTLTFYISVTWGSNYLLNNLFLCLQFKHHPTQMWAYLIWLLGILSVAEVIKHDVHLILLLCKKHSDNTLWMASRCFLIL